MTRVRIFRPAKTAMQSGQAGTQEWMLEFEPGSRRFHDPLMGWIGSRDTQTQVRLRFDTREEAIAYAERNGYAYAVREPHQHRIRPKSYADNFRAPRLE